MGTKFNGVDISKMMFNGVEAVKMMVNGVEVYSSTPSSPPYDANYMIGIHPDNLVGSTMTDENDGSSITINGTAPVKVSDYIDCENAGEFMRVWGSYFLPQEFTYYMEFMIPDDFGRANNHIMDGGTYFSVMFAKTDLWLDTAFYPDPIKFRAFLPSYGTWHKLCISEKYVSGSDISRKIVLDGTVIDEDVSISTGYINTIPEGYYLGNFTFGGDESTRPSNVKFKKVEVWHEWKEYAEFPTVVNPPAVTFEADILGTTDTNITVTMEGCSTYYINDVEYTYSGPFSMLLHWSDIKTLKTYDNVTRVAFANDFIASVNIKTMTSITSMFEMFKNLWNITSLTMPDLGNVTNFNSAFWGLGQITSFGVLNTSSGTDFENMFYNMDGLLTIGGINTLNQTSTTNMFFGCTALTSPNASEQSTIEAGADWTG